MDVLNGIAEFQAEAVNQMEEQAETETPVSKSSTHF
jgi:hypothetical protein